MDNLNRILSYFEENLCEQKISESVIRYKKVLNAEEDELCVKLVIPSKEFSVYPYDQAFYDMEKMMVNELLLGSGAAYPSTVIKTDMLPMIRVNYGVGQLASLFGINSIVKGDDMPWVERHLELDEIREIVDKGSVDIYNGLGQKMIDTQHFYKEKLQKYPLCEKLIKIYHPDLQGVFDTAHLLIGSEIYYMMYDEPELLHSFMSIVANTYIDFLEKLRETLNDVEENYCYHWGTMFKGNVVLRADTAVNLSLEMFDEFVKPYEHRVLKYFGGGSIHFCGKGEQWLDSMLSDEYLGGINFGQPPGMEFGAEFLQKIYPKFINNNKSIINYGIKKEQFGDVMDLGLLRGITYTMASDSVDEAANIIK